MGDQTEVTIDANLLVNSARQGAQDAWNYGPQAVESRQAVIDQNRAVVAQTTAQTDFTYGKDAREFRADENIRSNAQSEFDTGAGAQDSRNAITAGNLIINDVNNLHYTQAKMQEEQNGQLTRDNAKIVLEDTKRKGLAAEKFATSGEGSLLIQHSAEEEAKSEAYKTTAGFLQSQADLAGKNVAIAKAAADAHAQLLASTRADELASNQAKFRSDLNNAKQAAAIAKNTQGVVKPTNVMQLLSTYPGNNNQMIMDNAPDIEAELNQHDPDDMPPDLQQMYNQIKNSARYYASGDRIVSSITGLSQKVAAGQATPSESLMMGEVASMGVSTQDKNALLNVSLGAVPGGYQMSSPSTNKKSRVFSEEEFKGSPFLWNMYADSNTRTNSYTNNPSTQYQRSINVAKEVAAGPMGVPFQKTYTDLLKAVNPQIAGANQEAVSQKFASITLGLQEDVATYNPLRTKASEVYGDPSKPKSFMDKSFKELFDNNVTQDLREARSNMVTLESQPDGTARAVNKSADIIQQDLEDSGNSFLASLANPYEAQNVMDSFINRRTGGMPPSVLEANVKRYMDAAMRGNPSFERDRTENPEAYRAKVSQLRNTILSKLAIPVDDDMWREVLPVLIAAHPKHGNPEVHRFLDAGRPKDPQSSSFTKNISNSMNALINGIRGSTPRIKMVDVGDLYAKP